MNLPAKSVGIVLFAFLLLSLQPTKIYAVSAFSGAEGFGADSTIGGRGGKVIEVTNLNDSGTGSLRDCVASSGARTCIFKVGGTITLTSPITISNPNITIAGQTAPGGGITIKKSNGGDIFPIKTNQVIIRYLTLRPGPGGENHASQVASNGKEISNIIFDHNSISWGVDSNIETWYRVVNATFSWNIISEALNCSTHSKGCHSKGIMIGGYKKGESDSSKGSENISVHHNLIAHDAERTPLIQMCGLGQVINNITYNPQWTFAHQQDNCSDTSANNTVNWVGNYHKKGPDSTSNEDLKVIPADSGTPSHTAHIYVSGNIGPSRTSTTQPDSNWVASSSRSYIVSSPANASSVTATDANTAMNQVLADAGNSKGLANDGSFYTRRDAIDVRVVNDVKNGTGHIIDNPSQVGGWVDIASGTGYTDDDHDGMPNDWETIKGLNPNNASDGSSDQDNDGYTNLEEFLNGTDPGSGSPSSPTPGAKIGDVNSDGRVDIVDIGILIDNYAKSPITNQKADVNHDGQVNIIDIGIVIDNYLK